MTFPPSIKEIPQLYFANTYIYVWSLFQTYRPILKILSVYTFTFGLYFRLRKKTFHH